MDRSLKCIQTVGDVNILSNKATNISTVGDVNWKVGGNFNLDVQGEAKLISGKMFLEGSELRINEGTEGIGAPEASDATEGAGAAAGYMPEGEFVDENTIENSAGEQSQVKPTESQGEGGTAVKGGSVDTKVVDYGLTGSKIDFNKKISKHFTLKDLTDNTHFKGGNKVPCKIEAKRGVSVEQQIKNLSALAQVMLDPLVDAGLKFRINQAYRNGDSKKGTSDHPIGCAADLQALGGLSAKEFAEKAYAIVGLTSKQFLLEYTKGGSGSGWTHVAYNPNGKKSGIRVASCLVSGNSVDFKKTDANNPVFYDRRKG